MRLPQYATEFFQSKGIPFHVNKFSDELGEKYYKYIFSIFELTPKQESILKKFLELHK